MNIPSYLKNCVKLNADSCEERPIATIISSENTDLFEIWYYGDLYHVAEDGQDYIVNTEDAPMLVFARKPESEEKILLFDGCKYGYNAMFCDNYTIESINGRTLKKLDIPNSKIILEIGYGIEYEEEKEDYDFDEKEKVILIDERHIDWEQVLTDGFDYIAMYYLNEEGEKIQFLDEELA